MGFVRRQEVILAPALSGLILSYFDACNVQRASISVGLIGSMQVTSIINIKDDLVNAGGEYPDQELVNNDNLVTFKVLETC